MIGLRERLTVRLEIDFDMIKGELGIFHQNAIDHPVERLITMWADQITRAQVFVRLTENSTSARTKSDSGKGSRRKAGDIRPEPPSMEDSSTTGQGTEEADSW